jgi:hypothetical protein
MSITKVGTTFLTAGRASPIVITRNGVTAGNTLILMINFVGTTPLITGVTDSQGGTWAKRLSTNTPTSYNSTDTEEWVCLVAPGGNTTITIAYSGSLYGSGADAAGLVIEFNGVLGTDGSALAQSGTSLSPAITTNAPSQIDDLAVAILNTPFWGSVSSPVGWTVEALTPARGNIVYFAWQIVTNTLAATATWVLGASENFGGIADLYKGGAIPVPGNLLAFT